MALPSVHLDNVRSPGLNVVWHHGDSADRERRLVKIRMSYAMLEVFLKAKIDHSMVGTNVPEDLEVVGVYAEPDMFYPDTFFWVVCRSGSFEVVYDGNRIPERDFTYWRRDYEQRA